jgi:hypothetical protein
MFRILRGGLLATCCLMALPLFACGGDDDDDAPVRLDPEDWVADICEKARKFDDAQTDAIQVLAEADEEDAKELKAAIVSLVRWSGFALEDFVRDVERIGEPDIDSADKLMDAFRAHEKQQKDILNTFKSDVDRIDTDDRDYAEKVFDVLADVEEIDFRDRLEELDDDDIDDLIDLIDEDPDCSFILFNS